MADDRGKNWTFNTFFHSFRRQTISKTFTTTTKVNQRKSTEKEQQGNFNRS